MLYLVKENWGIDKKKGLLQIFKAKEGEEHGERMKVLKED